MSLESERRCERSRPLNVKSEYYTRGGKTQERDIREVDGLLK